MRLRLRVFCGLFLVLLALLLSATPTFAASAPMARLRIAHTDPDAPPVDVYVNGSLAFKAAAFANITQYAVVPPGSYHVELYPTSANGGGSPILDVPSISLAASTDYTAVAYGLLKPTPVLRVLPFVDDNSMPPTGLARVRLIHASPNAPALTLTVAGSDATIANVAPGSASQYAAFKPGTYTLRVTPNSGAGATVEVTGVNIEAGKVYTLYAVGLLNGKGTTALSAVLTVDASYPAILPSTGQAYSRGTLLSPLPIAITYLLLIVVVVGSICGVRRFSRIRQRRN